MGTKIIIASIHVTTGKQIMFALRLGTESVVIFWLFFVKRKKFIKETEIQLCFVNKSNFYFTRKLGFFSRKEKKFYIK